MTSHYFSALLPELQTRSAQATVGILGFSNIPLRTYLLSLSTRDYGASGAYLGEPVFEATFGWRVADQTMKQLSGKLLHPHVVKAMDKPWGESAQDYRFPATAQPYTHQLAAWQALLGQGCQSVVVTSGTGSGKTECFMVSVLSSIAQSKEKNRTAEGIQAIFLYPLNALIQSQRERLRAWTGPFDGAIRFCLYNGMTPEEARADKYREALNEVHDRETLRNHPPDILVTNPTMLEYMLVRSQDAPILDKSKGKLQWIVLDEAHNYIGSQAAELALLLRRVLHAFGTSADQVHFVATSATIGGDADAKRQLQEFLSRLAGVQPDRVTVVYGERAIPPLDAPIDARAHAPTLQALQADVDDAEGLYKRLSTHPLGRRLRANFVPAEGGRAFQSLSDLVHTLQVQNQLSNTQTTLQWLDVLTSAVHGQGRDRIPFLPLRVHLFHNIINGLWACANPHCDAIHHTPLHHPDWGYGAVYTEERSLCSCGSPVFPLVYCHDCNEVYLEAFLEDKGGFQKLVVPVDAEDPDEFSLDREAQDTEETEETDIADACAARSKVLILGKNTNRNVQLLDIKTMELVFEASEVTLPIRIQDVSDIDGQWLLKCPSCGGHKKTENQFRRPRLGAPFQLGNIIPTLLEFCPDGETPMNTPRRGRRMITFTDSRQGTARMAAKLQQDAERNALRAAVYVKLVSEKAASGPEQLKLENEIAQFRSLLPPDGALRALLLQQVNEKERQLKEIQTGKPISYDGMVAWLASQSADINRWIHTVYQESDVSFGTDKGADILAQLLLCREFGRRPKRQNSLETLGLVSVQYPKLALVSTRRPAVEQAGFTVEEWRDFLKITLDFFVRQYWAVQLPTVWQRWGGQRVSSKQILAPTSVEENTRKLIKWPLVKKNQKRQHLLIRLLACVLRLDVTLDASRHRLDALLVAAWEDLTITTGLLEIGADQGRFLNMNQTAFQHIHKAWICPITRRVLDVTLRGITPYLPQDITDVERVKCQAVELPVCDVAAQDHANDDARVKATRAWAQAQTSIQQARMEGIWSNLNDRIIEGAGYYRSVEHSAQQSGSRLEQYERLFKQGHINVMSCSTTMEMGVDIGGINMVAMNNVPPHPANYLQRAGRAGRRAETRSVALTVCKDNPHDQYVFRHTVWPFITQLRTPNISLSSPLLVQRHINSMLLAHFLRLQHQTSKITKLTLEWWMLPRGESRQERFVAWCECFNATKHPELDRGVQSLIRRTVFEGRNVAALIDEAAQMVSSHAQQWLAEWDAIDRQIRAFVGREAEDTAPKRALEIQMKRLKGEYLLRELATSGVLPGYGFPTDITTFETLNKDSREIQARRDKAHAGGREDNKFQHRELPSRDTVTALREYAPGAKIVIDGLVYESAGITLNWHIPASVDQVNELQNIRQAWRCDKCGASGTFVLAQHLHHCPECGAAMDGRASNLFQYLEPAGFSVDIWTDTHNDITEQTYVPVELPWITAAAPWIPLPNPDLGRFRAPPQGSVFHHSSGMSRSGYALCLECGRAAPMGNDSDPQHGLPKVFQRPHKRLRGGRTLGSQHCGGSDSPFKIKKGIRFGREYTTDVLELVLHDSDGQPLNDKITAYSIAVALRRAIAQRLGVEETELGCEVKPIRDDEGRFVKAIQVFDVHAAGYCSLVAPDLPQLLREVRTILSCQAHCDRGCHLCLFTFDTRYRTDDLDRKKALDFLNETWLDELALAPEHQLLGSSSRAEFQTLEEALAREINVGDVKHLYVYLHGQPVDWDLAASPLRRVLHRLSLKDDLMLTLVMDTQGFDALSPENHAVLNSLQTLGNISWRQGKAPTITGIGACLATVEKTNGTYTSWATSDVACAACDLNWGHLLNGVLVYAPTSSPSLKPAAIQLPLLETSKIRAFEISNQLNGQGMGFGDRFWSHITSSGASLFAPTQWLQKVEYEDRYLSTPVACALLLEVMSGLKSLGQTQDCWRDTTIHIKTMQIGEEKRFNNKGQWWNADWQHTQQRDQALQAAFEYSGMSAHIVSTSKREINHSRRLVLHFDRGSKLVLWLDQGWSYWGIKKSHKHTALFDMTRPSAELGEQLAHIQVDIEGQEMPTCVFLDQRSL